ncbi:MAG TPA: prolyl-tRNA synthetase [Candidatus Taylorbacteria bacterium]|nr:MAG: Prolyl-tRNA synthetase [Parcubacteria group bacterium GW2011_GWA2_47_64]KKU97271.1 MAG: Prolyl-tRNA synthetase [Parcubacteria group bacterium GW2011_GWC2_48_17]HBV01774.1 prolyl-tRNA synthetase [Candidatus Taylorbacteria bacterium]
MRQSQLFTKTRKEVPSDEIAKNAKLLIQAGYVHKEMAGVYSFLPLGLRVMNKIIGIIREEMNAVGGQELHLTALQDPNVWQKSGRWSDEAVDNWFKTKVKVGGEVGLAFTHEEPLTRIMKDHIRSYKDLPFSAYQFQTKFRNETRAKSGILRGREFLMKDMYSFSRHEKEHEVFYKKAIDAYKKIFTRSGIGEETYLTFSSGGSFSKYSHEFQTLTLAGEDTIHLCEKCSVAVNEEIIKDQSACPECGNKKLAKKTSVEIGNIFTLGTRFSEVLDLAYLDEKGEKQFVFMGSYGIGPGRIMGTIVELLSDEKGIVWPAAIAPFQVHLISIIGANGEDVRKEGDGLYERLMKKGIDVLYDDRDIRPGEKFADSDLIGIPTRVVISEKAIKSGRLEVKGRKTDTVQMLSEPDFLKTLS